MSLKERLEGFAKLDQLINCKIVQYDRARKVPTAEFCTGKAKQMAEEINADIDQLADERKAIMAIVDNTSTLTADELTVVYKHYLEGKSYERVAQEMYFSKTSVYRICNRALDKLTDKWETT